MPKDIKTSLEARAKIKEGIDKLADAVGSSLGPLGRTTVIEEPQDMPPTVTKDGVTIAKHIYLEDVQQNMGARMVRDVASKTVDIAGDGTTTATILAQAIYAFGLEALASGANPHRLRAGIDIAVRMVVDELKEHKLDADDDMIVQVGTISANNDKFIGELMGKAMKERGKDGVISLSNAIDYDTKIEHVDGIQMGRGWVDQDFVTDRSKDECVLDNVYILLWEKKLSAISPAIDLLKAVQAKQGSLLVIAEDIDGDALDNLKVNHARGLLKSCAVRIPGHPLHRPGTLQDIAALTGATAITSTLDMDIKDVKLEHLGQATRVIVGKENTMIIEGAGAVEDIKKRADELRALVSKANGNEQDLLQKRLASLTGGMVVIRVGAFTENEALEKMYRVEDAMHAVQAAAEEGVLPGGGTALARAARILGNTGALGDETKGIEIIKKACMVPLKTISKNAGLNGDEILAKVLSVNEFNHGFNALSGNFEDLVKSGVLDPLKVVRTALQNAASIAGLLLTVEVLISEKRPPEPK